MLTPFQRASLINGLIAKDQVIDPDTGAPLDWGSLGGADQAAIDAAVAAAVSALVDGAPGALDTLNELAAALGDDASFAATVTSALAAKASEAYVDDAVAGVMTNPMGGLGELIVGTEGTPLSYANVALSGSGASVSSNRGGINNNVIDGSTGGDVFLGNPVQGTTITINLGSAKRIKRWRFYHGTDANNGSNRVSALTLESSTDNTNWTVRDTETIAGQDSGVITLPISVNARYWRFTCGISQHADAGWELNLALIELQEVTFDTDAGAPDALAVPGFDGLLGFLAAEQTPSWRTAAQVRSLLGLVVGTDVQAYDADLAAIAALTTTSVGRSLLAAADAAALRAIIWPPDTSLGAYGDDFAGASLDAAWTLGGGASVNFPADGTANVTLGAQSARMLKSTSGLGANYNVSALIRNMSDHGTSGGMAGVCVVDSAGDGFVGCFYGGTFYAMRLVAYAYSTTESNTGIASPASGEAYWIEIEKVGTTYRMRYSTDPAGAVNWSAWSAGFTVTKTIDRIGFIRGYTNGGSITFRADKFKVV